MKGINDAILAPIFTRKMSGGDEEDRRKKVQAEIMKFKEDLAMENSTNGFSPEKEEGDINLGEGEEGLQ